MSIIQSASANTVVVTSTFEYTILVDADRLALSTLLRIHECRTVEALRFP
jgi:hypothetical protein